MPELILMRHAKTEQAVAGQRDFDRELTARGRLDAPLVAEELKKTGAKPDVALVSNAVRALQTWDLVKAAFPACETRIVPDLYLAEPEILIREALQAGPGNVLVIAHNPGVHELVVALAAGTEPVDPELQETFPTSAIAVFHRADPQEEWKLQTQIRAKDLRV